MSSEAHDHDDRTHIRREESPAQIEGIQDEYRKELGRRLRKLRGVLRETIVENDALGIKGGYQTRIQQDEAGSEPDIEARSEFSFEQAPAKQVAFRNQLQEWIDEGILEPVPPDEVEQGQHYTGIYATAAYTQGISTAQGLLVARGADPADEEVQTILSRPLHVDTLEIIYTRNYENLQDITEDIDRSVSEILANGLRQGWGTRKMGDAITEEVHDIQKTRARALARTEALHAHNESALRRYEEYGVGEVEILTHTPCPVCQAIEANDPYSIVEARGLIPAHPNCVCTWAPLI